MRYVPFRFSNGTVVEATVLPEYIAEISFFGRIKSIRVGWSSERTNDKKHFRDEMLRRRRLFADNPHWRKQIKMLHRHKEDISDQLFPRFMYFPLPESEYYWVGT